MASTLCPVWLDGGFSTHFLVMDRADELRVEVWDADVFMADDPLGTATLPVSHVLRRGKGGSEEGSGEGSDEALGEDTLPVQIHILSLEPFDPDCEDGEEGGNIYLMAGDCGTITMHVQWLALR